MKTNQLIRSQTNVNVDNLYLSKYSERLHPISGGHIDIDLLAFKRTLQFAWSAQNKLSSHQPVPACYFCLVGYDSRTGGLARDFQIEIFHLKGSTFSSARFPGAFQFVLTRHD